MSHTMAPKRRDRKGHQLPPYKRPNAERRSREYLTPDEVDRLIATARRLGRHGPRDATMMPLAYRHGLRVSELVALRWEQVDLKNGLLHVRRRKMGCRARTLYTVPRFGRYAPSPGRIPIRPTSLSVNGRGR